MKKTLALLALPLLVLLILPSCASRTATDGEISKDRAIEIAREHLTFEARSVEAEKVMEEGRAVWQVTFRGRPPGEGGIGEVLIVSLDRKSGEMVSIAMS